MGDKVNDSAWAAAGGEHTRHVDQVLQLLLPLLGLAKDSAGATQLRQLLLDRPEIDSIKTLRAYLRDPNRPTRHQTEAMNDVRRRLDAEAHHHLEPWQERLGVGPDAELFEDPENNQGLTSREATALAENMSYRLRPST
jgi:hypothetical protein